MAVAPELVGVYRLRGRAAVTYLRLTIDVDGRFVVESWMDFGGSWYRVAAGTVEHEGAVRLRNERRHVWDVLHGDFHVHHHDGVVQLVPEGETGGADPWDVFVKQPSPRAVVCRDPDQFGHALTAGRSYLVVEEDLARGMVRVVGDHRRLRWFPIACFAT